MKGDDFVIEEAIRLVNDGVSVTLPVGGRSMLPFIIGGRESVILQKPAHLKVGDIVLAWADNCKYAVHRIILFDGDDVILMGDGNLAGTERCKLQDIKAKATHFFFNDTATTEIYTPWRCRAAKLWWHLRPVRRYLLAIYRRM